jgi:hypothetical protein
MQKPITHFVESPSIHEFCSAVGYYAENLDIIEKTCLIATIAVYTTVLVVQNLDTEDISSEVYKAFEIGFGIDADDWFQGLGNFVGSLSWEQSIKFIQALTSNI